MVFVQPYTRVSARGTVHPVREHRRGTSLRFVKGKPLLRGVKLYRPGDDLRLDYEIALMRPSAYVELPDSGAEMPPSREKNTVYIVGDYSPSQLRKYPRAGAEISRRWSRILGHEALHLVLNRVEGPRTARKLDVPYGRHKTRSRGDISRGV